MCGIFGIWDQQHHTITPAIIHRATHALRHRGPDDEGYLLVNTSSNDCEPRRGLETIPDFDTYPLIDSDHPAVDLAFGFRRLSILDLSNSGHQPMSTPDGQLWIVFNGEIYNYIEIRQELMALGYQFRSRTDTEVILLAYRQWGFDCLSHFNGMWAFALWDNHEKRLFCARDRFGVKPFYYYWDGKKFSFASEIKALMQLPFLDHETNDAVIYDYLSANLIDHTSGTFFSRVNQLAPAHFITLEPGKLEMHRYWNLSVNSPSLDQVSANDYAEIFYGLFEDAVRLHLRSDVPIGTCLSGGLDSSAIVCVVNKLLFGNDVINAENVGQQQKTFSSCFDDPRFDERQYIKQVIDATRAESNYIFPSPAELLKDLAVLIYHQDEPFGSLSVYAQWCVMKRMAEKGIKVSLDGQGGDEIAGGYHVYFDYYWGNLLSRLDVPELWREWRAYHKIFKRPYPSYLLRSLRPFAPSRLVNFTRHLKRGRSLGYQTLGIHPDFARPFQDRTFETLQSGLDPLNSILLTNLQHNSIPKLLHYEDRNSMAHSVEARVPFLDYRLVEFMFSLPAQQKIHRGVTKVIMRNALKGKIPEPVRLRSDKMGFVTPERVWMANELHLWAKDIIFSRSFCSRKYFNIPEIHSTFAGYQSGKLDLTALAWRWINLELWLNQIVESR